MPLTNEQFARISREYEHRRALAREEQENRRQEVLDAVPEYGRLEEERLNLSMEKVKASLAGEKAKAAELDSRMKSLSLMKETLLAEAGFPDGYLNMPWRCPLCQDTGFADGEKCSCFRALSMSLFGSGSALWDRAREESFARFDLSRFDTAPSEALGGRSPRENMARHLETAKAYVRDFGTKRGSLLLAGPVGTGKTYLCNAIAGELAAQGFAVLYLTATEYFDEVAKVSFGEGGDGGFEELQASADLLIIDDLGMEIGGKFAQSSLFRTVNERLLKGRATVISTNLSLNEIQERYSERVASRIMGGYRVLRFAGRDQRLYGRGSQSL